MNYIELINHFWQLDLEESFSAYATRLYFFLLQECNKRRWSNPFELSNKAIVTAMGGVLNTMKAHRETLVERGLIAYQNGGNGAGDKCVYVLRTGAEIAPLKVSNKVSKSDTFEVNKVSDMVSEIDTFQVNKVSDKVSNFDTIIYKEENKNSSGVENEDDGGQAFSVGDKFSWISKAAKNPDASAAHTGGGAAASVAPAPSQQAVQKIPFSESKYASEDGFKELARNLSYSKAYAPYYIAQIQTKYETELRDERGWKTAAINYLNIDARKQQLVTQDLNSSTAQHHGSASDNSRTNSTTPPSKGNGFGKLGGKKAGG